MFLTFDGTSANDAWLQAAEHFRRQAAPETQSSRAGDTLEALHVGISVSEPAQRWVIGRSPPINPAFALAEVIWIMTGRHDAQFLNYFNARLPEFAGATPTYPGSYGFRLRHHHGLDQLTRAYEALRANPNTRQVVLQIWDAKADLPHASGAPASADIPCNITSILKVRDGKLEWLQIMRSNDLMRGLPYNLVQFTTLQEILAGWLGLEIGTYNHISDSLHVYLSEAEWLNNTQSLKSERNTDSLNFSKNESEAMFGELERATEHVINPNTDARELKKVSINSEWPVPFQNMMRVLCAEGARKRKCSELSDELMAGCTNPGFVQLWTRWTFRTRQKRSGVRFLSESGNIEHRTLERQ
jgi:thymidylate synthase